MQNAVILQKVDMHVQIIQKQTKSYYTVTEAEKNVAITPVSLLLADTNKHCYYSILYLHSLWTRGVCLFPLLLRPSHQLIINLRKIFLHTQKLNCHILTLSLRNFWHLFSFFVRNLFFARKKTLGMVTKMVISRLIIELNIKYIHHWNCE